MDAKYLQEIKAREQAATEVVEDSIPELNLELKKDGYDIFLVDFFIEAFKDIPALVAEVGRLQVESTVSKMEIVTLKRALELAVNDLRELESDTGNCRAYSTVDDFMKQAQEEQS